MPPELLTCDLAPSPPDMSLFSQLAEERIGNIRTVRAFGKEMTEIEKYTSKVDFVMQLARKEAIARAGFFGAVSASWWEVKKVDGITGRDFYPGTLAISRT